MHIDKLTAMVKGWVVGDFEPSVLRTAACEVAVKRYREGEREQLHHHKVATETTIVVAGRVRMANQEFGPDSIVTLEPGEATSFVALTDAVTVVVKLPSVRGDKYAGSA